MKLKQLLKDIYNDEIPARFFTFDVHSIRCHSKKVEPNDIFIAVKGVVQDGQMYIQEAIDRGAKVIVTSREVDRDAFGKDVCHLCVENPNVFLNEIASRFFGQAARKVLPVGITGTNGKTTITYLLESILKTAGKSCGVIGTITYRIGDQVIPAPNTTPGWLDNQYYLAEMAKQKIEYCLMEVSSHALNQGRTASIDFCAGVFTNLTPEHLDYHQTMDNYFAAKAKLFESLPADAYAVINVDDAYGKKMTARTAARVIRYGIESEADVIAENIQSDLQATQFDLVCNGQRARIKTKLLGRYNIYNILAAAAVALSRKFDLDVIAAGVAALEAVPGRLERVECGQPFTVLIDYAHTPDALSNVLRTVRETTKKKIILVFGCGGDRDATKRPLMGAIAGQLADFSVVTSDNPRTEPAMGIIDDILSGFSSCRQYAIEQDRTRAIGQALGMAEEGDVVLIAGKGHEDYQIFGNTKIPFNEKEIVESFLKTR